MDDLISRRMAINGKISIQRANGAEVWSDEAVPIEYLKRLPSVQPEQRWIPVSSKLPEYGESVLCYFGKDEDFGLNHVIDEEAGEWFFNGVTAWMPLPEPPKEGGQDG
jgi:hypothetical protein